MSKTFAVLFLLFTSFCCVFAGNVKYVFLLIGDGFGPNQRKLTETVLQRKLAMNTLPCFLPTGTNTFDGKTTDSAASGSAIACGQKTHLYAISVDKNDKPMESLASELKRTRGFSVAIMSSCGMTDATPAAQYAHNKNRIHYREIADNMVTANVDLFAGFNIFESEDAGDLKKLEAEYRAKLIENGWAVTAGEHCLDQIPVGKKTYAANPPYVEWNLKPSLLDRLFNSKSSAPTLADFLTKAISLFEGNPNGFYIMLECGRIDHSGHNNDAGMCIRETASFDKTIEVALAFQAKHPEETLIVITADHETGGLQILDENKMKENGALLFKQTMKMETARPEIEKMIREKKESSDVVDALEKLYGISYTDAEREELKKMVESNYVPKGGAKVARQSAWTIIKRAADMRDSRLGIHYTTGGHTSTKTVTNASGPGWQLFTKQPLENSSLRGIMLRIINGER